jgi:16S rRNA processing protein RimM
VNSQDNWIIIGRFGRPHGIKGFVTVHSFADPPENILRYTAWHAFLQKQWQPIKLLSVEVHNKSIIALVEGYPERETAARLTNVEIAINAEQLADLKPGEYYWHQLIGMKVINKEGLSLGQVTEIIPTGSNDVLVVQGEKRHLIPYLPGEFVINIDASQKVITVDWDLDF